VCDETRCPFMVTLSAARQVIDDLAGIHETPEAARGAVVAMRKSAEAVRSCYPCDGPVSNHDGQIRCPLGQVISEVHAVATVPANLQGWAFAPEKLADGETDRATGQYL
jgi:hypothetical protein